MTPLLLSLILAASVIEPSPHLPAIEGNQTTDRASGKTILVVADGSRSWSGAESDVIIAQLRSDIGPGWSVYVTQFDGEGSSSDELLLEGQNRDLVRVQPRTPLKDALALTLKRFVGFNDVSAIVVVAHEQLCPTYVRTDHLISSLRQSKLPVHTIHLSGKPDRPNVFNRIGRAFTAGSVLLIEALIEEDRKAYSAQETGRMLRVMSDETSGTSCIAPDRKASLGCADMIAARITESVTAGAGDRSITGSDPKP